MVSSGLSGNFVTPSSGKPTMQEVVKKDACQDHRAGA